MPEAGDRVDLRTSGQLEERHLLNERQTNVFITSSLMKQVLKSPSKSTMIKDLMKNYAQQMQQGPITILYHIEIQTHAEQKRQFGTTSKVVFNAKHALTMKDPAKNFVFVEDCYKALPRWSRRRQSNESTS